MEATTSLRCTTNIEAIVKKMRILYNDFDLIRMHDLPDADSIKLFVGQIPFAWTEKEIRFYFAVFGRIYLVDIVRDRVTQQSKGCCFIIYYNRKSAMDAQISWHNTKKLPGLSHPIQMQIAEKENQAERQVIIEMLSKKIQAAELCLMFNGYGLIEECTILRDANGVSKGCGRAIYAAKSQALNAVKCLHHSVIMEDCPSPLVVRMAVSHVEHQVDLLALTAFNDAFSSERITPSVPPGFKPIVRNALSLYNDFPDLFNCGQEDGGESGRGENDSSPENSPPNSSRTVINKFSSSFRDTQLCKVNLRTNQSHYNNSDDLKDNCHCPNELVTHTEQEGDGMPLNLELHRQDAPKELDCQKLPIDVGNGPDAGDTSAETKKSVPEDPNFRPVETVSNPKCGAASGWGMPCTDDIGASGDHQFKGFNNKPSSETGRASEYEQRTPTILGATSGYILHTLDEFLNSKNRSDANKFLATIRSQPMDNHSKDSHNGVVTQGAVLSQPMSWQECHVSNQPCHQQQPTPTYAAVTGNNILNNCSESSIPEPTNARSSSCRFSDFMPGTNHVSPGFNAPKCNYMTSHPVVGPYAPGPHNTNSGPPYPVRHCLTDASNAQQTSCSSLGLRSIHMSHVPSNCMRSLGNIAGSGNHVAPTSCINGPATINLVSTSLRQVPSQQPFQPVRSYSYPNLIPTLYPPPQSSGIVYAVASSRNHVTQNNGFGNSTITPNFPRILPTCWNAVGDYSYPTSTSSHMSCDMLSSGMQTTVSPQTGPTRNDSSTLFVYDLPPEFKEPELTHAFLRFGKVLSTKVFFDKTTNQSKCFGFVSYDNPISAENAIRVMNGLRIGSRRLQVRFKKSKDMQSKW